MCYLVERGLSALKGVVRGEPQKWGGALGLRPLVRGVADALTPRETDLSHFTRQSW